ncbi:MAG: hypothetical protein KF744_07550 [Taibaiella sp.]|nr:hypothetical protein [Taibaiella sp.]
MKKLVFATFALFVSASAFCSVTFRYNNQDDKGYYMTVKIDGEEKQIKIENGSSGTITVKGGNNACRIVTECGEVEVNEGDEVTVKSRCISVYRTLQQKNHHWSNY